MNTEYRRLGKSGLRVPSLSFGTGTFGGGNDFFKAWGSTDSIVAARLIDICLEHGVSMFDSADVYSDGLADMAEQILGQAIKGKRNRLLFSTKATFPPGDGPNDFGSSRQHLIEAVDKALQRRGTDHIYRLLGFFRVAPDEVADHLLAAKPTTGVGFISSPLANYSTTLDVMACAGALSRFVETSSFNEGCSSGS